MRNNMSGWPVQLEPKEGESSTTAPMRSRAGTFLPGHSGNRAGRRFGSRNKLTESFIDALLDHFQVHGPQAIARACAVDPVGYLRVIGTLLPRESKTEHSIYAQVLSMGVDEIKSRLRQLYLEHGAELGADALGVDGGLVLDEENPVKSA